MKLVLSLIKCNPFRAQSKKEILGNTLVIVAIVTMIGATPTAQSHMHLTTTNPPISREQIMTDLLSKTLFYGGVERIYCVHVPSSYDGSHEVSLVLALHPAGGNGYLFELQTRWMVLSEENGFIVVYPTGGVSYSYGFKWNVYNWVDSPDDVGFLMALINQLKSDYLIDSSRVYMTGHSSGASMTITFAFKYANVLAAIAPVSGRWMTTLGIDPNNISQPNAPLPIYIWQEEMESNEYEYQLQKQYWIDWNKVDKTPAYVTEGDYKTEIYTGGDAEVALLKS